MGRWSLWLGLVVCAGCARSDAEWVQSLESPDPFTRLEAALALSERPEHVDAVLPELFTGAQSDVARERQAARQAVRELAVRAPRALLDYRLGPGNPFPVVRNLTRQALRQAGTPAVLPLVEALERAAPEEAAELRECLVALVCDDSAALTALADLLPAPTPAARQALVAAALREVGSAAAAHVERLGARIDAAALGLDLERLRATRRATKPKDGERERGP